MADSSSAGTEPLREIYRQVISCPHQAECAKYKALNEASENKINIPRGFLLGNDPKKKYLVISSNPGTIRDSNSEEAIISTSQYPTLDKKLDAIAKFTLKLFSPKVKRGYQANLRGVLKQVLSCSCKAQEMVCERFTTDVNFTNAVKCSTNPDFEALDAATERGPLIEACGKAYLLKEIQLLSPKAIFLYCGKRASDEMKEFLKGRVGDTPILQLPRSAKATCEAIQGIFDAKTRLNG